MGSRDQLNRWRLESFHRFQSNSTPEQHSQNFTSHSTRLALSVSAATFGSLSVDAIAAILGYLSWEDILRARVCRTFREAAAITPVPFVTAGSSPEYSVRSLRRFEALPGLARALPLVQQLCFDGHIHREMRFVDGQDPEPAPLVRLDRPVHRIDLVANFTHLRSLLLNEVQLNGRYPRLFGFPHLQHLSIIDGMGLKLDLEMLSGLPSLRELHCVGIPFLRGSTASLRALRDTLRIVIFTNCPGVRGELMDLADFPLLEKLCIDRESISGDIRLIRESDFPALQLLQLPTSVYGSSLHPLARVRDAPELMNVLCRLKLRNGTVIDEDYGWTLAGDSIDRYPGDRRSSFDEPPFVLEIVTCGECVGWRWMNRRGACCATTWIDEDPEIDSEEYADFWSEEEDSPFKIVVGPLSEADYRRLIKI